MLHITLPSLSIKKEIEEFESEQTIETALRNRSRAIRGYGGHVYIMADVVASISSIRQMLFRARKASFNNTDPDKQKSIDKNIKELEQVKETLSTYHIQVDVLEMTNRELKAEIDLLKKATK